MKVSELEGALLDAWVARALGKERVIVSDGRACQEAEIAFLPPGFVMHGVLPEYSKDWAQGGPVMDEGRIDTGYCGDDPGETPWTGQWWAQIAGENGDANHHQIGPTRLIAAMRTFVASKYSNTVPGEAEK